MTRSIVPILSPQASLRLTSQTSLAPSLSLASPAILAPSVKLAARAGVADIAFASKPTLKALLKADKKTSGRPTTLAELDRLDNSTQIFSVDQASQLGFSFGSMDAIYSRRIYVKNFIQYREITENEAKVWYGIGIRWVVNVKVIDATAKLTGIPAIAASADSKSVVAQSQFQVYGLNNPEITKIAQMVPVELNLENYGAMYAAFQKITELIANEKTIVTPLIVATILKEEDPAQDYAKSLIVSWSIATIASGKTLDQSQYEFSDDFGDKEIIKSVYYYFTNSDDSNVIPDSVSREKAKKLLRKMRIKKSWW
jgi:hypothetical protein